MIMMRHKISDFVATSAREFVVQLPTITIFHGELSIDEEEPYFIKDPETGEVFAIIDTTDISGGKSLCSVVPRQLS